MTFDGALDVVSIPYALGWAHARALSTLRRERMARTLGLEPTLTADRATEAWARLAQPRASFRVVTDLLSQGGAGMIQLVWDGPSDGAVQPATADMADPDGANGAGFEVTFSGLLQEIGD